MSVRTDVINLNVNINGDAAKDQLNSLRTDAAKITAEMRNLKKGTDEWIQKNKELQLVNDKIKSLRVEIGLTALSQRELMQELKRLQMIKLNLTPQTKEFKDLQNQIDAVQSRLKDVRTGEFGFKKFWSSISTEVKQFGMLAAGYLGFDFVVGQTKNIIQMQTKMADEYSNIEKTTSLTKDQIKELDAELRKFDTRTSNSRLRELAADAGKLGKDGVADIKKFVEEADKIDVALGEDLGDEGLTKIAKISGILKEEMLNIASGINAVGAASAASEGYQVDFAFRLAGAAQTARLAAGDLFGFAAALEVNGQTAEVSGTAMSTFLLDFIANTEKFGKSAGYAKGQLVDMINSDGVNAAFLSWLQKMKDTSKTSAEFISKMNEVGIDGARGAGVFLVLANNIEQVKQQQELANKAVVEGTSVLDEFNTKNQNFAAVVEKLGKEFNGFFTSDTVNEWVKASVNGLIHLMNGFRALIEWVDKNRLAVLAWTAAAIVQLGWIQKLVAWIALQVTGTRAATIATIAQTLAEKGQIIVTTALGAAKALLTLNITKLRQEMRLLMVALGTNPWTALLVVVGALLVAFGSLISKSKEMSSVMRVGLQLDIMVLDSTQDKISKINQLVAAITNENTTTDQKRKLMQQLIALDPVLLKGLNDKNIATAQGKKILDDYILKLKEAAHAEALLALQSQNAKRLIEIDLEDREYFENFKNASSGKKLGHMLGQFFGVGDRADMEDRQAERAKLLRDNAFIESEVKKNVGKGLNTNIDLAGGDLPVEKKKKKGKTDEEKAADKKLKELEALKSEIEKVANDIAKKTAQAQNSLSAQHSFELEELGKKYAELVKKAEKHGKSYVEAVGKLKKEETDLLLAAQDKELAAENYKDSLKNLENYIRSASDLLKQQYANGTIDFKDYEAGLKAIEFESLEGRNAINEHFAIKVEAAAEDLENTKTAIIEKGISDREILEANARKSALAFADYNIAIAPEGSEAQLNARKEKLELERKMRIEEEQLTQEELMLIDEEFKQKMNELDHDYWSQKAEKIISVFQKIGDILTGIFSVVTNKEEQQLLDAQNRDKKRKSSLERRLASGTISQQLYDKSVAQIESQADARNLEFQRKKAKRDKASAIFNAIINTAMGVTAALSQMPPASYILAAITAAAGAVQIAAISSQPLPRGRKGLVIQGPSHEVGGIDMINKQTGQPIANIEGGEPVMVLSKNTYGNNKEVIDALINSSQNQNGARIPNWYMQPLRPLNSRIVNAARETANSGAAAQMAASSRENTERLAVMEQRISNSDAIMEQMVNEQRMTRAAIMQERSRRAIVVLKDIEDAERRKQNAKLKSGIR